MTTTSVKDAPHTPTSQLVDSCSSVFFSSSKIMFVGRVLLSSISPTAKRSMGSKISEGCTSNESLVTRLGGRRLVIVFVVVDVSMMSLLPVSLSSLGISIVGEGALARREREDSNLSIRTSLFEYRENASERPSMKTDLRLG